jgi:hypothetical protein
MSPRLRRPKTLSGSLVLLLSWGGLAAPMPAVAEGAVGPQRLVMQIAADSTVVEAIRGRLAPALKRLDVQLELAIVAAVEVDRVLNVATDAGPDAPMARAWLDGRAADAARLFIIPRNSDRIVARRVGLNNGFDEVALAEIAYVVERSVASLLASQPVGAPRAELRAALIDPPPSKPPPQSSPAPTARPPDLSFQIAALAGLSAWSTHNSVVPQLGIATLIERQGVNARLGIWLMGQLHRSLRVETPDADLAISGGSAQLMLVAGHTFEGLGVARLAVGPGLTVTRVNPTPIASSTKTIEVDTRSDVDLMFRAAIRWDFILARGLTLLTAATLDAAPAPGRYTAIVDGKSMVLASPWPVQPTFFVGLAFTFPRGRTGPVVAEPAGRHGL